MRNKKILSIDSSAGGNGDIWMRLVSFYSMAALLTDLEIQLLIPKFMRELARYTFGDRLTIIDDGDNSTIDLSYTNLGLRNLVKGLVKGKRYISPYQRAVIKDKKQRQLKDVVNLAVFNVLDFLSLVQVPKSKWITVYQGYLDVIGIKQFRKVNYSDFVVQLQSDYGRISKRLNQNVPVSKELILPPDLKENLVIFPTGTSRQFIPVSWARKYLPNAYYAFFYKDKEAAIFQQEGLKTVLFYLQPADIIVLSKNAKWTITTDSFPSHLLQSASQSCTVTITEVLKSRIVSPSFKGKVVDSQAKCHPCLHLDRKNHPLCAAGFSECINWENNIYSENILTSAM
jgi:hypothetical protein